MRLFCENTERQLGEERKVVLELISEAKAAAQQVQVQIQVCFPGFFFRLPVIR